MTPAFPLQTGSKALAIVFDSEASLYISAAITITKPLKSSQLHPSLLRAPALSHSLVRDHHFHFPLIASMSPHITPRLCPGPHSLCSVSLSQAPPSGQSRCLAPGRRSPRPSSTSAAPCSTAPPGATPDSTGQTRASGTPGDEEVLGCQTGTGEAEAQSHRPLVAQHIAQEGQESDDGGLWPQHV